MPDPEGTQSGGRHRRTAPEAAANVAAKPQCGKGASIPHTTPMWHSSHTVARPTQTRTACVAHRPPHRRASCPMCSIRAPHRRASCPMCGIRAPRASRRLAPTACGARRATGGQGAGQGQPHRATSQRPRTHTRRGHAHGGTPPPRQRTPTRTGQQRRGGSVLGDLVVDRGDQIAGRAIEGHTPERRAPRNTGGTARPCPRHAARQRPAQQGRSDQPPQRGGKTGPRSTGHADTEGIEHRRHSTRHHRRTTTKAQAKRRVKPFDAAGRGRKGTRTRVASGVPIGPAFVALRICKRGLDRGGSA